MDAGGPKDEATDVPKDVAAELPKPVEVADDDEPGGVPGWAKIGGVFTVLVGVIAFLLINTDADSALVYSKLVDEVMANPASFVDRELRVEGELREGSIQFRREPCEWRFVLFKNEQEMRVAFPECVVPDTFRDGRGISVTVQGRIAADGSFTATEVVPRCPSKYEMEERARNGEVMPHAPTQSAIGG